MPPDCPHTGRRSYHGPHEAVSEALALAPRRNACAKVYRAYLCRLCGHWHATKLPFRADQKARYHRIKHQRGKHDQSD